MHNMRLNYSLTTIISNLLVIADPSSHTEEIQTLISDHQKKIKILMGKYEKLCMQNKVYLFHPY